MMAHRTLASITLGLVLSLSGTLAHAATPEYYGRWSVSDEAPAYSSKGIVYKTIDIAPCGNDFCGISVSDNNTCGDVLFRFFTTHTIDEELVGHGKWGKTKKKLEMGYIASDPDPSSMYLALGADDMDMSGREGSIPTFEANYKRVGNVTCTTK